MTTPGTARALTPFGRDQMNTFGAQANRRAQTSGDMLASPPTPPDALLAHHSDLTLRGLTLAVASVADVCAAHTALPTLLTDLTRYTPQLIIMEDRLSDLPGCTAIGQIRQVRAAAPEARLIVMGDLYDGVYVADLLAAGADAYLCLADTLTVALTDAIRAVLSGRHYLSPAASANHLAVYGQRQTRRGPLDSDERRALALLIEGCGVPETMRILQMTRARVYHLHRRLRARYGVATNEALIQRVLMAGLPVDGE
ncbi:MAG: hypothetical protein ACYDBJ_15740 [Aggregatilineales bacterium]